MTITKGSYTKQRETYIQGSNMIGWSGCQVKQPDDRFFFTWTQGTIIWAFPLSWDTKTKVSMQKKSLFSRRAESCAVWETTFHFHFHFSGELRVAQYEKPLSTFTFTFQESWELRSMRNHLRKVTGQRWRSAGKRSTAKDCGAIKSENVSADIFKKLAGPWKAGEEEDGEEGEVCRVEGLNFS